MKLKNTILFSVVALVVSCSSNSQSVQPTTDRTDVQAIDSVQVPEDSFADKFNINEIRNLYRQHGPVRFPFYFDLSDTVGSVQCNLVGMYSVVLGILPDTVNGFDVIVKKLVGDGDVCYFHHLDKNGKSIEYGEMSLCSNTDCESTEPVLLEDDYIIMQKDLSFKHIKDILYVCRLKPGNIPFDPHSDDDSMAIKDTAILEYTRSQITGKITADRRVVLQCKYDTAYMELDEGERGNMYLTPIYDTVKSMQKGIKYDWNDPQDVDGAQILGIQSLLRKKCHKNHIKSQLDIFSEE